MGSVRQELLELIDDPDTAYDQPPGKITALQLQAADDLFQERRHQIPLVGRRAADAGIERIGALEDLVPLLFTHTVYKSYPQAFVDQGRWDRMLRWLQTLSVQTVTDVDVEGVTDVDEWISRLQEAGHQIIATSGTTGKCSFLNQTRDDQERKRNHFRNSVGWPFARPGGDRPFFWLGPLQGANSAVEAATFNARHWARPDAIHALTGEPLRIAQVSQAAVLRKRMADGTATPEELAAAQADAGARAQRGQEAMRDLADTLLDHRHEPIFLSGQWAQHLMILHRARERGIPDGDFHPGTVVNAGGGIKSVALPADFREQVAAFYGKVIRPGAYGMTELAQVMPRCEAGRYHRAPGLITLVLDGTGERLLSPGDGLVEGRFAFLDLAFEGRWGGVITGDKVTADFSERCPCGRYGPTVLDTVTRFAQAGEDDHIGCAGTIDAYIRGVVGS